jgi:di/tricarboxylate transporter
MLMATWWMTEAIPIPATSLLPLVLFPFFDIASVGVTAAPYAHSIVFLVLGGVLLGLATQRWNLHRRFCRELCLYAAGRNAFQCRGVRHGRSAYPKHD